MHDFDGNPTKSWVLKITDEEHDKIAKIVAKKVHKSTANDYLVQLTKKYLGEKT